MLILGSLSLLQVQDSTKFGSEIMELPKLLKDYECAKHGQERLQLCWWLNYGDNFRMLVAESLCSQKCPNSKNEFVTAQCNESASISYQSLKTQSCHQHKPSPTTVTNIDVAVPSSWFALLDSTKSKNYQNSELRDYQTIRTVLEGPTRLVTSDDMIRATENIFRTEDS